MRVPNFPNPALRLPVVDYKDHDSLSQNDWSRMPRNRLLSRPVRLASVVMSGGLLTIGLTACQPQPHTALVVGDGTHVALSQSTIKPGLDTFTVISNNKSTGASNITLFRLKGTATLGRVTADLKDEFSDTPATAAKGTRELVRDINASGLADIGVGLTTKVTTRLATGTYYLMDLANYQGIGSPAFTPLVVTGGSSAGGTLRGNVSVQATSADRFVPSTTSWPHTGSYVFTNVADTIHFMDLQRVKPGTTDAQVQAYFGSPQQGPPPFALPGPGAGNDVVSPGNSVKVEYNLPAGTYVLLCFIADDVTGMPHATMGMHKVITLH
jgi:hypothetical protein